MACDNTPNTVLRWIRQAYRLAGATKNTLEGQDIDLGKDLLNEIIDVWGRNDVFIFFDTSIEFDVSTIGSQTDYTIGPGASNDVVANMFVDVFSLNYQIGGIDYRVIYAPPKSFNAIGYKNNTSYPSVYTFEVKKDFTLLRIFPRPTAGMVVKVNGRQSLSNVSLFQTDTEIPAYAVQFLKYALARQLVNYTGSNPQPGFDKAYQEAQYNFTNANKIDLQIELGLPFYSGSQANNFSYTNR